MAKLRWPTTAMAYNVTGKDGSYPKASSLFFIRITLESSSSIIFAFTCSWVVASFSHTVMASKQDSSLISGLDKEGTSSRVEPSTVGVTAEVIWIRVTSRQSAHQNGLAAIADQELPKHLPRNALILSGKKNVRLLCRIVPPILNFTNPSGPQRLLLHSYRTTEPGTLHSQLQANQRNEILISVTLVKATVDALKRELALYPLHNALRYVKKFPRADQELFEVIASIARGCLTLEQGRGKLLGYAARAGHSLPTPVQSWATSERSRRSSNGCNHRNTSISGYDVRQATIAS